MTDHLSLTPQEASERRAFPRFARKLPISYEEYNVFLSDDLGRDKFLGSQTVNISKGGLLFHTIKSYSIGTLLKVKIKIPNFWSRKAKKVTYEHVVEPKEMSLLCRVVRAESTSAKRKHRIAVATVNIDLVDEQILSEFLQEQK